MQKRSRKEQEEMHEFFFPTMTESELKAMQLEAEKFRVEAKTGGTYIDWDNWLVSKGVMKIVETAYGFKEKVVIKSGAGDRGYEVQMNKIKQYRDWKMKKEYVERLHEKQELKLSSVVSG